MAILVSGVNKMSNNKTIIKYKGQEVWCYGVLTPEDNIHVCYDEDEGIMDNWCYETKNYFSNWTEVVHALIDCGKFGEVQQLEPC